MFHVGGAAAKRQFTLSVAAGGVEGLGMEAGISKKFTQARRNAFLRALKETGNQTIAAERAKVSSSWVQLHRSTDPAFRAAVADAVEAAKVRLRGHGERAPPSGWGFLDGAEMVVRGTGGPGTGRRVQIARARVRQWTPRMEKRFLTALRWTANVHAACAEVGMTVPSVYAHRRRWPGFARRWAEALEDAMVDIEYALLDAAENFLGGHEEIEVMPLRCMTVMEAAHIWTLFQKKQAGGRGAGRLPDEPPIEAVRAKIIRAVEVIERRRGRSAAHREAVAKEHQRRWQA